MVLKPPLRLQTQAKADQTQARADQADARAARAETELHRLRERFGLADDAT